MSFGAAVARAYGVARSVGMYYGPVWRRGRMEAFYRQFLRSGDLAFDIGCTSATGSERFAASVSAWWPSNPSRTLPA